MVPVIWYYPRAAREPALMDQVPKPWAGNRLTVREYQMRWLDVLAVHHRRTARLPARAAAARAAVPDRHPARARRRAPSALGAIAFPVLGKSLVAPPAPCHDVCDSGADAVVYGQKMQPIIAA